jgi:hypothetical protein
LNTASSIADTSALKSARELLLVLFEYASMKRCGAAMGSCVFCEEPV